MAHADHSLQPPTAIAFDNRTDLEHRGASQVKAVCSPPARSNSGLRLSQPARLDATWQDGLLDEPQTLQAQHGTKGALLERCSCSTQLVSKSSLGRGCVLRGDRVCTTHLATRVHIFCGKALTRALKPRQQADNNCRSCSVKPGSTWRVRRSAQPRPRSGCISGTRAAGLLRARAPP